MKIAIDTAEGTERLLRADDVLDLLPISKTTLYRWADEGVLDKVRIGKGTRAVFFKLSQIQRLIDQ
ncbi:helix-turn-helix transcriptional regulator [Rhodospirillum sp. A1_3_36]|uniref:helix-turn-helix transcriptional regulator n=1 Tax=Rhodospirillum sp. A1_3_36 TaxID=3391666 RepID=UPI0039A6F4E6